MTYTMTIWFWQPGLVTTISGTTIGKTSLPDSILLMKRIESGERFCWHLKPQSESQRLVGPTTKQFSSNSLLSWLAREPWGSKWQAPWPKWYGWRWLTIFATLTHALLKYCCTKQRPAYFLPIPRFFRPKPIAILSN